MPSKLWPAQPTLFQPLLAELPWQDVAWLMESTFDMKREVLGSKGLSLGQVNDLVADHEQITWLSCPDHVADHILIT